MNLLDSLLDAIVRLEGDALVMHVGEKPYVVTTTSAMNELRGPLLWGHVDLSSRVLTSEAVLGLLEQVMPLEQRQALANLGAVEHQIDGKERNARFSVIAARAGDDVWLEVRKRPKEAPVAVESVVHIEEQEAAQPVAVPRVAAIEAPIEASPIEPSAELPVEQPIEEPIAEVIEEPVYLAGAAGAIERSAVVESLPVAENTGGFEHPRSVEAPGLAPAVAGERDETPAAPFEIIHEVNQDAPTDADVDALLAEGAAALLRSATPAVDREPLDIDYGAWQELERHSGMVASEPEPESVSIITSEPAAVAEATQPMAAEPMRLASESESIAIASELEPIAIAPEPEHASLITEVEFQLDAMEPEPMPVSAEAEYEPIAFDEQFELEQEFLEADATEFLLESVAMVPQLELVLAGAASEFEAVTFGEDFRLVAPTADAFAPDPVASELETGPDEVNAAEQPELFAFADAVYAEEGFRFAEAPERVTAPVAAAPQPERAEIPAEPEPQPVSIEPEPAATTPASDSLDETRRPIAIADASDPIPMQVLREHAVMASAPVHQSEPQPERAVVVPLAPRLPAVAPGGESGAKAGPVRQAPTLSTTADPPAEFSLHELLRLAAARGASTVYLVAQSRPMVRAEGDINVLDVGASMPLDESDIARLMLDFAPESARDAWQRGTAAEWICDVADAGRVRCMTFRDHRGPGLIFRMIPQQAISADHLGLTQDAGVQALCIQSDGLVLVTGPRASGKSTLMSAFVDLINRTRGDHVITIESQIEFVHESRRSFVSQREVPAGDGAVVSAVRSALREDPDVLFIGDLSSAEVAAAALDAAESGRLVFASLPAASTVAAVDRLLELLPADRPHARAALAASLRGVVAEVLVGRARGGRVAAREVLLNTAAVADLIQDAKTDQLPLAMENGRRHGMMPLNDALTAFVREGTVHVTEAYRKAFDKPSLLAALRQEGIDTSFAEKIA